MLNVPEGYRLAVDDEEYNPEGVVALCNSMDTPDKPCLWHSKFHPAEANLLNALMAAGREGERHSRETKHDEGGCWANHTTDTYRVMRVT